MGTAIDNPLESADEADLSTYQTCPCHGLLYDTVITTECPLCEKEREDRLGTT